jgi:hypothetical protein
MLTQDMNGSILPPFQVLILLGQLNHRTQDIMVFGVNLSNKDCSTTITTFHLWQKDGRQIQLLVAIQTKINSSELIEVLIIIIKKLC